MRRDIGRETANYRHVETGRWKQIMIAKRSDQMLEFPPIRSQVLRDICHNFLVLGETGELGMFNRSKQ